MFDFEVFDALKKILIIFPIFYSCCILFGVPEIVEMVISYDGNQYILLFVYLMLLT